MGLYVNPNNDAFKEDLNLKIFVDKSELISLTNSLLDSDNKFMCVSRPRRFGKTIGVNLLTAYYSKGCDSKELFSNLKIAKNPDFETHLNKYNVISICVSKFKEIGKDVETVLPSIISNIKNELKAEFPEIQDKINRPLLFVLSEIYKLTQEKFIIFIDDWDYIFRVTNKSKVRDDYLNYLIVLFSNSPFIKLAYLTGLLPVKKYKTMSSLNNFDEYTMINPGKSAEYFGYTEDEMRDLCVKFNCDYDDIKTWYDGYLMSYNIHLFNPRSIKKALPEGKLKEYWFSIYYFEVLGTPINRNLRGLHEKVIKLLGGERVNADVSDFQSDIEAIRYCDEILTLLVHIGYLSYDESTKEIFIPNHEIRAEFGKTLVRSEWKEVLRALKNSDDLLKATWNLDEKSVAEYIVKTHLDLSTLFKFSSEETLRLVLSIAYHNALRHYSFNKEYTNGKDIADLILIPYKNSTKPLIVIELKHCKTSETLIDNIKEKKYPDSIEKYTGDIILVGLTFDDRRYSCEIEKISK